MITETVYELDTASNPIEAKEPFCWIDLKSIDHILLSGPIKDGFVICLSSDKFISILDKHQ